LAGDPYARQSQCRDVSKRIETRLRPCIQKADRGSISVLQIDLALDNEFTT
jgi:hypothetical protein